MRQHAEKSSRPHISVMLEECLRFFSDISIKTFFEGTVGAGGHAKAILSAHPEIEAYFACDKDVEALAIAKEELQPWKEKVKFIHGDFVDVDEYVNGKLVDGFFLT